MANEQMSYFTTLLNSNKNGNNTLTVNYEIRSVFVCSF